MEEKPVKLVLPEVKNPIFIEGYPGIGLVGHIAGNFLAKELGMEMIGYVESPFIPPMSIVLEGKPNPPLRFYGKDNVIVAIADIYVPPTLVNEIAKELASYLSEMKAEKVISIGGIGIGFFKEKMEVWGVGAREELNRELEEAGAKILQYGSIMGMSGKLLWEAGKRGLNAYVLLGETFGDRPDPRAAANVIEVLKKLTPIDVSTEPLIKEAEMIEEQLRKMHEQMEQARKKEMKQYESLYL
ncbi:MULTISPECIES: proteasome assembly chaperone family protein [Thermococcus]|uniref:Archaeal enzymes of ATP-grasp superfamily n=1 Tax=Thermococcus nautili TaxID=195522 RepID=W8P3Q2_9EURY|nr:MULTISPECIES: proteasome assembly chaperone family protein [Thermococcus]AHL23416.1 Archaeal enzymes of ATP-grasp superfamily [Thermococcus nautili]NJE49629.1 proteasome assembly chaperone family protein [Thermococcus sp. 9N3]CAI1492662.1 Archaeal enzymes of ATP-grasp superfamily [Thermococcus nautili]